MILNHKAKSGPRNSWLERFLDRTNPNVVCVSLLSTAGLLMTLGFEWGVFFAAGSTLAGVVGGLVASWFVLLRPDPGATAPRSGQPDFKEGGAGPEFRDPGA